MSLVLEKQGNLKEALAQAAASLRLGPTNTTVQEHHKKLLELANAVHEKKELPEEKSVSKDSPRSKKIIENRPNAESLQNQHSRKSSAVARDIISAKSTKSQKQIG